MQVSNKFSMAQIVPIVNFKGITSDFSRRCYANCDELETIVEKYPEQKRMIGELPKEWSLAIKTSLLAKNPNLNRDELNAKMAEKISEFNSSLGEAAKVLRENKGSSAQASVIFNHAFKTAGITRSGSGKIIGTPIEKGNLADVYLINKSGEKKYVFKVFRKTRENKDSSYYHFHGTLPEANRAAYWDKKADGDSRVKFCFSNPNSGFMVNEYISSDHPAPSKPAKGEYFGLRCDDDYHPDNSINGVFIDYGGMKVINGYLNENKTARYVYTKVSKSNNPKQAWNKFFTEYENEKNKDRKIGLGKGLVAVCISSEQWEDEENKVAEILENSDNEVKKSVIENFEVFSEESRAGIFTALEHNANNEIKQGLVKTLILLDPEYGFKAFKSLAHNASNDIKKGLIDNIGALNPEDWLEGAKILAQDADKELKELLSQQPDWMFSEDEWKEIERLLNKSE